MTDRMKISLRARAAAVVDAVHEAAESKATEGTESRHEGTITEIRHGSAYDDNKDDLSEVTIRHGKAPKKGPKGMPSSMSEGVTSRVYLKHAEAKDLQPGHKVAVTLERC
jgi:hypothetical protein